jgi:hypothetical protein
MQHACGEVHHDAAEDHVAEEMPALHDAHQADAEPEAGARSKPENPAARPDESECQKEKTN